MRKSLHTVSGCYPDTNKTEFSVVATWQLNILHDLPALKMAAHQSISFYLYTFNHYMPIYAHMWFTSPRPYSRINSWQVKRNVPTISSQPCCISLPIWSPPIFRPCMCISRLYKKIASIIVMMLLSSNFWIADWFGRPSILALEGSLIRDWILAATFWFSAPSIPFSQGSLTYCLPAVRMVTDRFPL